MGSAYTSVQAPQHFHKDIERDATDPVLLLAEDRIVNQLFPTGALFLSKKIFVQGDIGSFNFSGKRLTLERDKIVFQHDTKTYETSR